MKASRKAVTTEAEPDQVAVRFLVYDAPYRAGQVHRFPGPTAARLVASGVAEYAAAQGEE